MPIRTRNVIGHPRNALQRVLSKGCVLSAVTNDTWLTTSVDIGETQDFINRIMNDHQAGVLFAVLFYLVERPAIHRFRLDRNQKDS